MNYYEELGLPRNATTEQIRQAWRNLARLLHPDRQGDGELGRLAECQMRRLNEIAAVLTDPVRRRQYDLQIDERPAREAASRPVVRVVRTRPNRPLITRFRLKIALSAAMWSLTVLLALATFAFLFRDHWGEDVDGGVARAHEGGEVARLRQRVEALERERAATAAELTRLREGEPLRGDSRIAGRWIYLRPDSGPSLNPFAPEAMELVVEERGDTVRGRFRARYRVGQPVDSPEIAFRFEGRAAEAASHLPWKSETQRGEPASGELRLTPMAGGALRLEWFATEPGSFFVIRDSAILIRRREP